MAPRRSLARPKARPERRLSGGLAHDLGNLLAIAEAEIDRLARAPESDQAAVVARAVLARARRVVARLAPPRPESVPGLVDVGAAVRGLAGMIAAAAGSAVALRLDLAEERLPVRFDPVELDATILDLALNALAAMGGGGTLTVTTEGAAGEARLTVADSGPGMTAEVARRATRPGFTTGRGHGLGLALAADTARRHGGRLEIESAPGCGTRVRLDLPLAAPETVLVVERDARRRRAVAARLAAQGYAVVEAEDAAAAARALATLPIDRVQAADSDDRPS